MTVATWSYRPDSINKRFVLVVQWLAIIVREALVLSPLKESSSNGSSVFRCFNTMATSQMVLSLGCGLRVS